MATGNSRGDKNHLTLKVWWAGHLIREMDLELEEVTSTIEKLKGQVKRGELMHLSCGVVMDVDEIVIDVHGSFGWRPIDAFKRK